MVHNIVREEVDFAAHAHAMHTLKLWANPQTLKPHLLISSCSALTITNEVKIARKSTIGI